MPAIFKDFGVEFLYPENWAIVEQTDDDPQTVALETPSGAQWTLHGCLISDSSHYGSGDRGDCDGETNGADPELKAGRLGRRFFARDPPPPWQGH